MCGIAGTFNWGDTEAITRMVAVQAHRGPDDSGVWETVSSSGDHIRLGSRRLAILDLSPAGHMPMSTPDGAITITYNGEIYNYPELRKTLEDKGYTFRSGSDTEAILYLYQEHGPDCVRHLNGMFAIAIWDQPRQQLFLARDHLGIKPLYYCEGPGRIAFASEMKALLELPGVERQLNYTALHQYLTFLWVPDPLTILNGILKIPAGHYAIFKNGQLTLTEYWDLRFPRADHPFSGSEADLAHELHDRFFAAVKRQLLSDMPVGAFLSAGLDSSSIVAAMAKYCYGPVRTYTVGFADKYRNSSTALDDVAVAQRTAEHFGCKHTEIIVEPDIVQLLPKLIWHMDEPTSDPALLTAYVINQEAERSSAVLLSGVGGDELFGGYRKYQAHFLAQRYRLIPKPLRTWLFEPFMEAMPAFTGTRAQKYVRLAKKMARSGSLPPKDRFIMDSVYLSDRAKHELYASSTREQMNGDQSCAKHLRYFDRVAEADFMNQMLYVDSKTFMCSLNLNYNDKMSMASSVEVRVPFLDRELVEWSATHIPPHLKLHGQTTKHILREAMRKDLPAEVLEQKKTGFGAPVDYWLRHDLHDVVDDALSERCLRQRGLFDPKVVRRYVDEQRRGSRDWGLQVWQFLTLELWMRAFIDSPVTV